MQVAYVGAFHSTSGRTIRGFLLYYSLNYLVIMAFNEIANISCAKEIECNGHVSPATL